MKQNILCLALFLLLGSLGCHAQGKLNLDIAEFSIDETDLSAKTSLKKLDGNGNPYAIVKVVSTNPDDKLNEYMFQFGNMSHSVIKYEDDILWLYVQRNARNVSVSRPGYVSINRRDLGYTLESSRVYMMTLTSQSPKVQKQWVQFSVSPADSKALVWYKPARSDAREEFLGQVDENGQCAKSLPHGEYSYRVLAENYEESNGVFRLLGKETLVEKVSLASNAARITLRVEADADIYVDGVLKNTRSWTGLLQRGDYLVECRQANHKPVSQNLRVETTDSRTVTLPSPQPILGTLDISSVPLGATITIDGKDYGKTPRSIDVIIGEHNLSLSMSGYKTAKKSFGIKEDDTTEMELQLEKEASQTAASKTENPQTPAAKPQNNQATLQQSDGSINGHEYVDLGLPSGLKWATCNVGATKPEEYGDYFAWADTKPKSEYSIFKYKTSYYNKKLRKLKSKGIINKNKVLNPSYDAACANWGGSWRMPTSVEMQELVDNTTSEWTTQNGVYGRKVTSKKNGNSIFLPAAGYRYQFRLENVGKSGNYWSSSPNENYDDIAYELRLDSNTFCIADNYCSFGWSVRPVSK